MSVSLMEPLRLLGSTERPRTTCPSADKNAAQMAKIIVTLVPRTNRAKFVPMVTELSHINRTLSKTVWHIGTM